MDTGVHVSTRLRPLFCKHVSHSPSICFCSWGGAAASMEAVRGSCPCTWTAGWGAWKPEEAAVSTKEGMLEGGQEPDGSTCASLLWESDGGSCPCRPGPAVLSNREGKARNSGVGIDTQPTIRRTARYQKGREIKKLKTLQCLASIYQMILIYSRL